MKGAQFSWRLTMLFRLLVIYLLNTISDALWISIFIDSLIHRTFSFIHLHSRVYSVQFFFSFNFNSGQKRTKIVFYFLGPTPTSIFHYLQLPLISKSNSLEETRRNESAFLLDVSWHFYTRGFFRRSVCPSIGPSVGPSVLSLVGLSVYCPVTSFFNVPK